MNINLALHKLKCIEVELLKTISFKTFQTIKEVAQLIFLCEIYV